MGFMLADFDIVFFSSDYVLVVHLYLGILVCEGYISLTDCITSLLIAMC